MSLAGPTLLLFGTREFRLIWSSVIVKVTRLHENYDGKAVGVCGHWKVLVLKVRGNVQRLLRQY